MFLEFTYIRLNVEFGNMKQANTTFPFFTALVNGRGHSYTHIRQQKPRLCRRSSSRGRWSRRSSSNNNMYCSLLSTKKVNFIQFSLLSWVFFLFKVSKIYSPLVATMQVHNLLCFNRRSPTKIFNYGDSVS